MIKFMTVEEVADRWRVSRMSIYRLIARKELEVMRVGRVFRIPETSVDGYEAANVTSPVEQG